MRRRTCLNLIILLTTLRITMLFQHYTTDDLVKHQDLLSSPLTIDNMKAALAILNPNFYVHSEVINGDTWYSVRIYQTNKLVIHGCTFRDVMLDSGNRHPEFSSIRSWVYNNGIPYVVDIPLLKEDFPELVESHEKLTQAARAAWQLTYNNRD